MASTVSAWAKPGAWAMDSEENESELREQLTSSQGADDNGDTADFPSLSVAAATKTKKKKKPQAISVQEFNTYGAAKTIGMTTDEVLILPTGPRQRTAEELDRNRLGNGFRNYGARDEQPRRQRDSNREFTPSRADESDSWASEKKSYFSNNGPERRERSFFPRDSQSRADDVDNWATNKSFVPSEPRRNERRVGFGFESRNGGGDSDNWLRTKGEEGRRVIDGGFDSLRERRGSFVSNEADSQSWFRKTEEVNAGSTRPRLNLQPRTLPLGEGQNSEISNPPKPKGNNPFGDARPREDVLKEKGQDWKEIDDKFDSMKLKEVASLGSAEVPAAAKRNFWSRNRMVEDKVENAWRKSESVDSRPRSSAGGSENGNAETTEKGEA